MNWKSKNVLITGGVRRIGREIGIHLARRGLNIVFTYRSDQQEASETEQTLRDFNVEAAAIRVDLDDLQQCEQLVHRAKALFGRIDILVHNASEFPRTPLSQLSQDLSKFQLKFDQQMGVHMRAPLFLGMRLGLEMKRNGWGRIINITDAAVATGAAYKNYPLYLTTKYGLYGLTQVLAVELAPEVTVNSVAPGFIRAPAHYQAGTVEELRRKVPLQREGGESEIAEDVWFLIRSEFKTGSVILTDGGVGSRTDSSG